MADMMANIKGKMLLLPFRIGTTSYIYADDILPNVHKLEGKVDDIELILFEAGRAGNIPGQKDLEELKRVGSSQDLTYTVHLPLDIDLGSGTSGKRKSAVEQVGELVGRMSVLNPHAYILHMNLSKRSERNIGRWQGRVSRSLEEIAGLRSVVPQNIAIENLSYPFGYIDTLVLRNGFSICVDIGHLIVMGIDPLEHLKRYFGVTRVIHLHGVDGRKDHVSLKHLDAVLMRRIIRFLKDNSYRGVLTLEIFSQTDFYESMGVLWENIPLCPAYQKNGK